MAMHSGAMMLALAALCFAPAAQAKGFHVLYKFEGGRDGTTPMGGLIRDRDGNLYGTTAAGGDSNEGTVFKLAPDGTETVLHSFDFSDGGSPQAGVIRDAAGNLYGTTEQGGGQTCECGAVFKLAPDGKEKVLHGFDATDGTNPTAGLIRRHGDFYGTTYNGGGDVEYCDAGCGIIFKLAGNGDYSVLYTFAGPLDGANPASRLITDNTGNFFGTTGFGGSGSDRGVVFKFSSRGEYTVLHTFTGGTGGGEPFGRLVKDRTGNLYGTASSDGSCTGCGVVFRLAPDGTYTVIYSFKGGADGASPFGGLLRTRSGALYGTTEAGGGGDCNPRGCGTVYRIDPDGNETILHAFAPDEGIGPVSALIAHGATLYGTAPFGGNGGNGSVFSVKK